MCVIFLYCFDEIKTPELKCPSVKLDSLKTMSADFQTEKCYIYSMPKVTRDEKIT